MRSMCVCACVYQCVRVCVGLPISGGDCVWHVCVMCASICAGMYPDLNKDVGACV